MKKLLVLIFMFFGFFVVSGCDFIEKEIDRAASIELEDYSIDMANQVIYLKITSNVDEQVIQSVVVNDIEHDLIDQGNNWYTLEDIPVATSYVITRVYYLSSIGIKIPFDINFTFDITEALGELPIDMWTVIDGSVIIGEYTFSESAVDLVDIDSVANYTVEELDDWLWLILEDGVPIYAVFEIDGILYVTEAPEDPNELMN